MPHNLITEEKTLNELQVSVKALRRKADEQAKSQDSNLPRTKSNILYNEARIHNRNGEHYDAKKLCIDSFDYANTYFGYVIDTYKDKEGSVPKAEVLKTLGLYYTKILNEYIFADISVHNSISLSDTKRLTKDLTKVISPRVIPRDRIAREINTVVLNTFNENGKDNKWKISEQDEMLRWIADKDNFTFADEGKYSWVKMRFIQNLCKQLRLEAINDASIAKKCVKLREEAIVLILSLQALQYNIDQIAIDQENAEILYMKALSARDMVSFEKDSKQLIEILIELRTKAPNAETRSPRGLIIYTYLLETQLLVARFKRTESLEKKASLSLDIVSTARKANSKYLEHTFRPYSVLLSLLTQLFTGKTFFSASPDILTEPIPPMPQNVILSTSELERRNIILNLIRDIRRLFLIWGSDRSSNKWLNEFSDQGLKAVGELMMSSYLNTFESEQILKKIMKDRLKTHLLTKVPLSDVAFTEQMSIEEKNLEIITALISSKESSKLEIKQSFDHVGEVPKNIVGMANTGGGHIVLGFGEIDKKTEPLKTFSIGEFFLCGIKEDTDRRRQLLSDIMSSKTGILHLDALYTVTEMTVFEKKVIIVDVEDYLSKHKEPVSLEGVVYVRHDNRTDKLSNKEALTFVTKRLKIAYQ